MDTVFIFQIVAGFIWGFGCGIKIKPPLLGFLIAVLGSLVIGYLFSLI